MSQNKKWTVNYTWSQPYSMNPAYANDIYNQLSVAHELQRLEDIDRAVEAMDSFPEAEKIIQKIKKSS